MNLRELNEAIEKFLSINEISQETVDAVANKRKENATNTENEFIRGNQTLADVKTSRRKQVRNTELNDKRNARKSGQLFILEEFEELEESPYNNNYCVKLNGKDPKYVYTDKELASYLRNSSKAFKQFISDSSQRVFEDWKWRVTRYEQGKQKVLFYKYNHAWFECNLLIDVLDKQYTIDNFKDAMFALNDSDREYEFWDEDDLDMISERLQHLMEEVQSINNADEFGNKLLQTANKLGIPAEFSLK